MYCDAVSEACVLYICHICFVFLPELLWSECKLLKMDDKAAKSHSDFQHNKWPMVSQKKYFDTLINKI